MKTPAPNQLLALACLAVAPAFAQGSLVEGNKQSPVRVLIYEDLQCPDCAQFRLLLDEKLLPAYGARVAFIHRDFPLAKHAWARPAAIASRYIQGRSEDLAARFRRETMAALRTIKAETFPDWLKTFCAKNGLDASLALAALDSPALAALVQADFDEGVARGIARTPTALVNGEPFIETIPLEQISAAIERALKENPVP